MDQKQEFQKFAELIENGLCKERIMEDIKIFNQWERYTGTEAGEKAAEFIAERMDQLNIAVDREKYQIYRSLPGNAFAKIESLETTKEIPLTPYVYSGSAKELKAEVVFDEASLSGCSQKEMKKRMERFSGKVVLTYESSFSFACAAKAAGAVGILTIWQTNLAHHGTLGGVWGSPEPEDLRYHYPRIPFAEILKDDGESLRAKCEAGEKVEISLTVEMDDGVYTSMMPIAKIQGKSEKFVLVSGHYDSWYEGITDNGVANAAMMEMARVFKENQQDLERSVVFAWWSGHSDGRYSGSTWYYDNHWEELNKNCVAHINMDICGCKGSDLVGFNSSLLEGEEFAKEFLKEFNEEEPIAPIPMARFADQTFWGAAVPFAIMPKFSKRNVQKLPFFWWHTKEDTIDKIDEMIVLRDAKVVAKLAAIFTNMERLPAKMTDFVDVMEKRLYVIQNALHEDFDLTKAFAFVECLKKKISEYEEALDNRKDTDDAIIGIAGEMVRITYTASSQYHQDLAVEGPMFPALSEAMGLTPDNTEADYYLAVKTRFVRQRNRLCGQITKIIMDCDNQMYRWETEK